MPGKLKFGLIGLGEMAYGSTGKVLQETESAEMVVGMDVVEHVARSYEETYGIPCSTNMEDVLGSDEVDAVIVSTPHNLHAPLGIEAARAGKHVIVEKPLATTLADADALIDACRDAGVLCSSKEAVRVYEPAVLGARELVQAGVIGEVMAVQLLAHAEKPDSYWTGGYSGRVQTTWRQSKREAGGGILLMNYVYDILRVRFVTGLEVTRVSAEMGTYRTEVEVEDYISASLRLSNGATGTICVSSCIPGARAAGGPRANRVNTIVGTAGQISFEGKDLAVYTEQEGRGDLPAGEWVTLSPKDDGRAYHRYFDDFARAALGGGEAPFPGEEGRRDLEVILAAYRSGERHQPVSLPMGEG